MEKRRRKTVASLMLVRPDAVIGSPAERWLLRRVRLCGFAAPGNETLDAAVRNVGVDREEAAEALASLLKRGWLSQLDGILFLTREGQDAAETAARLAPLLGDPPVPIPESHLPEILWIDDA